MLYNLSSVFPGLPGERGTPGLPGPKGDDGKMGATGPMGIRGFKGNNESPSPHVALLSVRLLGTSVDTGVNGQDLPLALPLTS